MDKHIAVAALGLGLLLIVLTACGTVPDATQTATSSGVVTVVVTATPHPQPTATPDLSVYQSLANENCFTGWAEGEQNTLPVIVWVPSSRTLNVTVTMTGGPWVAPDANMMTDIVFNCFRGFYTSPHARDVQDIVVVVNGPLMDKYGNTSTKLWGRAELKRTTANVFNWQNLDALTAWEDHIYDNQYAPIPFN